MLDIAHRAGVSKTAVSFAFNDPSRLSEATARQILEIARELGYSRDPLGRMLNGRRTDSLGLLLPQELPRVLANPYFTHFMRGLGQICHREGLTLLLVPPLRGSLLKAIPYAAVDAFIVIGLETDRGEVQALRQRNVPFVLVDSASAPGTPSVVVDDQPGARALMAHILELGHRDIAILAFESGTQGDVTQFKGPLARRLAGYQDALEDVGLSLNDSRVTIKEVVCSASGGRDGFRSLWETEPHPTAVIATSDIVAIGALEAVHSMGIRVPDEVSIAGFDDLPAAGWVRPSLTTVHQPMEAKGRLAAESVLSEMRKEDVPTERTLYTTLIVRESTGPAPVKTTT